MWARMFERERVCESVCERDWECERASTRGRTYQLRNFMCNREACVCHTVKGTPGWGGHESVSERLSERARERECARRLERGGWRICLVCMAENEWGREQLRMGVRVRVRVGVLEWACMCASVLRSTWHLWHEVKFQLHMSWQFRLKMFTLNGWLLWFFLFPIKLFSNYLFTIFSPRN